MKRHWVSLGLVVVAACYLCGCSSPGRSSSQKTTGGVTKLQQRVDHGEKQMDAAVSSLTSLVNNLSSDLRPQYKKFLDALAKLESQIKHGKGERAAMAERAEAYFARWNQDIQSLENEELRKVASQRRDEAMASFKKMSDEIAKAKPSFEAFMRDLKEIQKVLDFDLTPAGVAAVKPIVGKVESEAAAVKKSLGVIREELARVSKEMSSVSSSQ